MKKQIKRVTAFLLSLVTIFSVSSCTKKLKKIESEKCIQSVSDNSNNITNNEITSTLIKEEDLSCDCTIVETITERCNLSDTTQKKDITDISEMISEEKSTTFVMQENELNIICSDPDFSISEELRNIIETTITNFNSNDVAFTLCDMSNGITIQYNNQESFNGACIVKPGIVLYLLNLAENNKLDIMEKLKYPGNIVSGSGYLNAYYNGYQAYTGQEFTILELMYHTLYYSDNNAYSMLYKYVINNEYYDDYKNFMSQINADSFTVSKDLMWVRNAKSSDGVNMIFAINDFIQNSKNGINANKEFVDGGNLMKLAGKEYLTYGEILYWIMINGKYDYLENYTGISSLSKTGFVSGSGSLSCRNIISLCYAERPYALCLLTKGNNENLRKETVKELLKELNEVMKEYDVYKKENEAKVLTKKY